VVYQDHLHFTAVAGVHDPRPIDHANAVACSQSATWRHQTRVPFWDCDSNTGWHHDPLTGRQPDGFGGTQVDAGITAMGALWGR